MNLFWQILQYCDDVIWGYLALIMIISIGLYLTIKSRFYQFKTLVNARKHIKDLISCAKKDQKGIHPIKLYFASVGGMAGLGNLVSVMTAVTIGGPGSLLWLWLASFIGMLVKYSEIYLGIKFRVKTDNGYDGGPMYFLKEAFANTFFMKIAPIVISILLCIYGAEVYQFLVLTDTISSATGMTKEMSIAIMLILVLLVTVGGVSRLSNICVAMVPPFMISYLLVGLWIIFHNISSMPTIMENVFISAFTGHGAIGGFAGSTILMAAHYGVSRAVYSGDIGIGYDSVVQSETQTLYPEKQARLAIFGLFADSLICTISILLVLVTDIWHEPMNSSHYIIAAIKNYIPFADIYITIMFFIAGFTTVVGYLVVGRKSAKFLHNKWGSKIYLLYSVLAFTFFSYFDQDKVIMIMSVSGGIMMIINIIGIFRLRNHIVFS